MHKNHLSSGASLFTEFQAAADYAPVLKVRSLKAWFDELGVEELQWPEQSSASNHTEHL